MINANKKDIFVFLTIIITILLLCYFYLNKIDNNISNKYLEYIAKWGSDSRIYCNEKNLLVQEKISPTTGNIAIKLIRDDDGIVKCDHTQFNFSISVKDIE